MHVTMPLAWWELGLLAAAVLAFSLLAYRRASGLRPGQRRLLKALRATSLGLVVFCMLGPVTRSASFVSGGGTVAVLVDQSRSMALADQGGVTRIEHASAILRQSLVPALSGRWSVETLLFGDGLRDPHDAALAATANRSDIGGAVTAAAARFVPLGLAGLVVVSDGARTDSGDLAELGREIGVPVVTVGVGRADASDLAVRAVTTSESRLDASLVDLTVTAESRGLTRPFDLRLLQNGRVVERRRLVPTEGGGPLAATFTVAPDRQAPTLYTVNIPQDPAELTPANNQRSVLVPPPGRRRRVLVLEGAPGFEHAFLTRAWAEDPSLDVDSIVRKGRDEHGDDTFFVQAAGARAESLVNGFPATRASLYTYDAVVLANQDARLLSQEQLGWLREFVGSRGGGLLVVGARSFDSQALAGSPIEDLLPLRPEGGGIVPVVALSGSSGERVRLTPEGARHPMMRIGATDDDGLKRWAALPALAGHVKLGAPRPGASVLAVADGPAGVDEPLIAVQRFGPGRTMVFAGEASWRWKMMLPSDDRTYDRFWRQAARWLTADAPDPVSLDRIVPVEEGGDLQVAANVRDAEFHPAPDAAVLFRIERPDGAVEQVTPTLDDPARGRFVAKVPAGDGGVSHARVEATRGGVILGAAEQPWLSGGFDRELADPRLDERALRRLAEASGGAYLAPEQAGNVGQFLQAHAARPLPDQWRDWWHTPWMLGLLLLTTSVEWTLRRQWGLK